MRHRIRALDSAAFTKKIRQRLGGDDKKVKALIEGLPSFSIAYEAWYSEALALLRQLLPGRVGNTPPFPTWLTALWAAV
jgi:hypothetical protein